MGVEKERKTESGDVWESTHGSVLGSTRGGLQRPNTHTHRTPNTHAPQHQQKQHHTTHHNTDTTPFFLSRHSQGRQSQGKKCHTCLHTPMGRDLLRPKAGDVHTNMACARLLNVERREFRCLGFRYLVLGARV